MCRDDGEWLRLGLGLMILELVLLHSGAFMASVMAKQQSLSKRLQVLTGLFVFYALMVLGFALSLDSQSLLWIFGGVCLGYLATALTNAEAGGASMMARSANGVLLYILIVFGTVFLPVPEWGVSAPVLTEVYPDRSGGLWEREPERAIAGAALYFLLMDIAEIKTLKPRKTENQDDSYDRQTS